ncbi:A/G-specific adenine glycosylase [Neorhodopirellula lusitana]|uniref:A/G-specific adenine glycosylase n=1 Tax=Neorhodopirellula lusitana TaxID=445327 RepID=UPI0038513112
MEASKVQRPEFQRLADTRVRSRLRKQLLDWFTESARDLPWRRDPTPYKVWVSEIMCQQTQIATVIPYFERFIEKYPDESALAQSDEAELMRLWEGLGYYRRARSLRAAAQVIVEEHQGQFPLAFDAVLALPGIGRYTAGAILSISQNQRLPILEGNTIRVFSRWIGMRDPVDEKATQDVLWQLSETMLLATKPSQVSREIGPAAFNQAAMELGALVCTPRQPKCLLCPVAKQCEAYRMGWQEEIPIKLGKTKYESRTEYAALLQDASKRWLVRQLPEGVRFAGMWDFPKAGPPQANSVQHFERWLSSELGGHVRLGDVNHTMKHAVTKYRITLQVHLADWKPEQDSLPKGNPLPTGWKYCTAAQLSKLPMSTTGRRLLKRVTARAD